MILTTMFAGLAIIEFAVVGLSASTLTRRLWSGSPVLGILFAITGVAAASWIVIVVTLFAGSVGDVVAGVILLAAVIQLVAVRAWRDLNRELLIAGMLLVGAVLVTLGTLFVWASPVTDPYTLATMRFTSLALPVDNQIPYLFAQTVEGSQSTHQFLGDWNGSDRPPLQSGFILLGQLPVGALFDTRVASFAPSVVAQALWAPAAYCVLRALGFTSRGSVLGVGFAAIVPTTVANSAYTWPKLLSAALIIVAAAALVHARREPDRFGALVPLAVVAAALGAMAHGAAVFATPMLLVLGVLAWRRAPRGSWRVVALGVFGAALTGAPWLAYQKFVDPPGDRLLKWHLAGVVPIDGRAFWQALVDAYSNLSVGGIIDNKLANLEWAFFPPLWAGRVPGVAEELTRRDFEFYFTSAALSVGIVLLAVLLASAVIGAVRRRSYVEPFPVLVIALCLGCVVAWALTLFGPYATLVHQGSHVWIVLLLVIPAAWVAERSRFALAAAAAAQLAVSIVVIGWFPKAADFRLLALLELIVGLGLLAVAARIPDGTQPRSQDAVGGHAISSPGSMR